jgi:uncharacterized protein
MKPARTLVLLGITLPALWIALTVAIGIASVDWALHPRRRMLTQADEAHAQSIAQSDGARLTEVGVRADDGVRLRGWSIRPLNWNGDAVILLHGQSDNRAGMLGNADLLLRHGYAVLLPDARSHGASGGVLATYGVLEAADLRQWFNWLRQLQTTHCIDGLGESMGAAQLLASLREIRGFCAIVAESAFASFREAAYDRLGQQLGTGAWAGRTLLRSALAAGFLYTRWRYGIDLEMASPENAVAESTTPVLLFHGKRDTNLPPRHSEMIQAKNGGRYPKVALWEPAEAGHCGAAAAEPAEYERHLISWFRSHDMPA